MRRLMKQISIAALALLSFILAHAQSGGGYDLTWWTIDAGGITFATGGTFHLGGTAGQPDATSADELAGGTYRLTGGFWFLCCRTNGDVNWNGCVDDADLLIVLFAFGASGPNAADANCDGIVDDADLLIVLFNFGAGC